jgi:hypothetical protein
MIARITSHPLPRLAVLTSITLSCYSQAAVSAELSTQENGFLATNLDQQLVFALLTPMSRLVASPYTDPAVIENPLRLPERSVAVAAVAHCVINRSDSAPSTSPSANVLKVDVEKPDQQIKLAPPEVSEQALPTPDAALASPTQLTFQSAFAMAGR